MIEEEARYQGTALGEADGAVVRATSVQEVEQPGVGGADVRD